MAFHNYKLVSVGIFLLLVICAQSAEADWWDDFVSSLHDKLVKGADYIRDEAGPTIREKFDGAKEKLQDPETHEQVQEWIKEKAVPVLEEKWQQFKSFINDDVAPEVQKIYEAGVEANERRKAKQREQKEKLAAARIKQESYLLLSCLLSIHICHFAFDCQILRLYKVVFFDPVCAHVFV